MSDASNVSNGLLSKTRNRKQNSAARGRLSTWQIKRKGVKDRAHYILQTAIYSDCRFIVGTEPNKQVFLAHRFILAMSSPVFEAMLIGERAEKNDPIPIPDVEAESFKVILEYVYIDKAALFSIEEAREVWTAAVKYMVLGLADKCIQYVKSNISAKTACIAYEFGKFIEKADIMEESFRIIQEETVAVLNNPSFENVQLETILSILDCKALNISSECDLCRALYRWGLKECKRKSLPGKSSFLRSVVGPAIKKIRFLTIIPKEFSDGPALLLSKDELFAIFMNISNPLSSIPMPDGFCSVRAPRDFC